MRSKKFVVNPKTRDKIVNMEVMATIPSNNSQQHLMTDSESPEPHRPKSRRDQSYKDVSFSQWLTVAILFYVNLINYMDRYTIAGVLTEIRNEFNIGEDMAGLLQTAFVLSYMICAPVFGYLGDRYNRRYIMAFGVSLWCLMTFAGSFMSDYLPFLLFRSLVGIGEASYSTIAPTLISDLFLGDLRSQMLALFYFAIPIGSGLGYIVGSTAFSLMGTWPWSLRVTPVLGGVAVVLILFFMTDPERGEAEGRADEEPTSYKEDLRALWKNPSFMFSTLGFTCVAFVTGALAWFGPHYLELGVQLQEGHEKDTMDDIALKFGLITMLSGLIGVPLGSYLSQHLKHRHERADPLICAFGLLASAPLVFAAIILAGRSLVWCFVCMFLGEVFLNLNWSIVADMLLYVVAPLRRSTAEAFQILISHAFGDAGSPYLIGLLSEMFRHSLGLVGATVATSAMLPHTQSSSPSPLLATSNSTLLTSVQSSGKSSNSDEFLSLQYALYITSFVEVLGGVFFLLTSLYIVDDRTRAEREISGEDNPADSNSSNGR
uniref:Protein spinster n=1 Tax=Cacopsylla melanoneura TaxID=428564 RepID=A0A8D8RGQ9_9HEMI